MKKLFKNKWVKFTTIAVCYLLWVIWMDRYIYLLGLGVIYDMYISKKVPWAFWKLWKPKTRMGKKVLEWTDAIIFAVIAATFIRMFFIEAYTIPTSSMEKKLLVGDYLFVSKMHYGPKLPQTPVSVPLTHNVLPMTNRMGTSFSEVIQWDYRRLAGWDEIENDEIVVFNFPEGDTVALERQNESYYSLVRQYGRDFVWKNYTVIHRPTDKCDNYIKRCVAIAGDTLEIKDGQIYINGKAQEKLEYLQYNYIVQTDGSQINSRTLSRMGIAKDDQHAQGQGLYIYPLVKENVDKIQSMPNVIDIRKWIRVPEGEQDPDVFPQDARYKWNIDFFGPPYIPKKGATIAINEHNLPLYKRIIGHYEGNKLEVKAGKIFINDKEATTYTFKMNYYFMIGDNRHNSLDSRFWGYVPEDHIVGKPMFIWLSLDKDESFPSNIRFSRMFRAIGR